MEHYQPLSVSRWWYNPAMTTPSQANLSSPQDWLNPWGLTRIDGVAVASLGDFVDKFGNPISFTAADFSAMSQQNIPAGMRPGIHIGHPNATFIGEQPRLGSIESLYFDGQYLRADYVNVPIWNAMDFMDSGRFPQRSMELRRDGEGKQWRLTGCAQLGSSAPAIEGMPPITQDMCKWMDPAAHEDPAVDMSLNCDPAEIVWLAGAATVPEPKETTMGEVTQAQLEAMQKQISDLSQQTTTALQEKDDKINALTVELAATKSQAGTAHLAAAQYEVVQLSNALQSDKKVTAAMLNEGNLNDILLHARLNCPPMTDKDGKQQDFFSALSGLLNMQVSLGGARLSTGTSGTPPAYQLTGDKTPGEVMDEKVRAEMAKNPQLSYSQASDIVLAGRTQ